MRENKAKEVLIEESYFLKNGSTELEYCPDGWGTGRNGPH